MEEREGSSVQEGIGIKDGGSQFRRIRERGGEGVYGGRENESRKTGIKEK